MKPYRNLMTATLIVAMTSAFPAFANSGQGNGKGKNAQAHRVIKGNQYRGSSRHAANCPPGLAKKNPSCVPPGQARKGEVRYKPAAGEILRVGDYRIIRDPRRYDLDYRNGWDYYRDDRHIYRVDSDTRKILAVLNLVDAFTN
ncbi:hypothetical protein PAF17_05750 [Paracoccus sp. Z330]|uniref:Excinuclease ABC subunit A n=1 Tax=Paracoccus onchidii TaxID=3017813 RepID=A0ABT4ZCB4_9RHOB|nr:hypothetical protein [Paracoccus onchidii]MDB6177009.1 hypothetical protein [Paracoccus onchidii]